MSAPLVLLTGASGVGKTTLLETFADRHAHKPWACYHFDSIGVPPVDQMTMEYGSPSGWQEAMTHQWARRLAEPCEYERQFLEGQMNILFIREAFAPLDYQLVLIDLTPEMMQQRLQARGQPELFTEQMQQWLAFLRAQAQQYNVPIVRNEGLTPTELACAVEDILR